ncbi:MAG: methionine--tRNA ligase [Pseudomonadales bacterium]|nr:methionine--tRNA ligase [Pseudomonadales bacterium]
MKHLGNLIGSLLPADAYVRFLRAQGQEVLYICATDEHGTPAELAARDAKIDVAEYCRNMWQVQSKLISDFDIDLDYFGRSSSNRNHQLTQYFAEQLEVAGYLEAIDEDQVYCISDDRFLPDRYIIGTCPNCGFDRARGDQCEECTKQLDPADLIDPRSAISGATDLEVRSTRHLHMKQSLFVEKLDRWISTKTDWPVLTTSIAKKWLHDGDGLQDRSITRDLDWGVPVRHGDSEWVGMEGKVFYVWFDAPISYIAATAEWSDSLGQPDSGWQRWWMEQQGAGDVRYVQFMGKDNVPFHTLSFPCTLIGANEVDGNGWKLVDYLKSTNWLVYEGGKFSTSQKRGVFMDQALDLLPSDYWRWWLLSNIPEGADSNFTWESLQTSTNKDLADTLGNFISRVTKFCSSKYGDKSPDGTYTSLELEYIEELSDLAKSYAEYWESIEIRKASNELRKIWAIGNRYLQISEPWKTIKTDNEAAKTAVRFCLNLIRIQALFSAPFIPNASKQILSSMGIDSEKESWPTSISEEMMRIKPDHSFTVIDQLFSKLDDEFCERMRTKFSGA